MLLHSGVRQAPSEPSELTSLFFHLLTASLFCPFLCSGSWPEMIGPVGVTQCSGFLPSYVLKVAISSSKEAVLLSAEVDPTYRTRLFINLSRTHRGCSSDRPVTSRCSRGRAESQCRRALGLRILAEVSSKYLKVRRIILTTFAAGHWRP